MHEAIEMHIRGLLEYGMPVQKIPFIRNICRGPGRIRTTVTIFRSPEEKYL
jgi:hypothetical protein